MSIPILKRKIIGISGVSRSGKNTLAKIISDKLKEKNINTIEFSLANELKIQINDFVKKELGICSFTVDSKEKNIIRPIMVAWGKVRRDMTEGRYWTSILSPKINNALKENLIPIITDIRYDQYINDEVDWLKKEMNGYLIHVTRLDKTNTPIKAPNSEELENDPKVKLKSDYFITWPTSNNLDILYNLVNIQLKDLLSRYE